MRGTGRREPVPLRAQDRHEEIEKVASGRGEVTANAGPGAVAPSHYSNPLHLFHWIPSFDPEYPITPEFGRLLVARPEELVDVALGQLFNAPENPSEG